MSWILVFFFLFLIFLFFLPVSGFDGPCFAMNCPVGRCIEREGLPLCVCDGEMSNNVTCEMFSCDASFCSGQGECIRNASSGERICACDEGFVGNDCSVAHLDSSCQGSTAPSCENGGRCKKGKCVCKSGFSGPQCSFHSPSITVLEHLSCPDPKLCSSEFAIECHDICRVPNCLFGGIYCREFENRDATFDECMTHFNDGECDELCSDVVYGLDGGDCLDSTVKLPSYSFMMVFELNAAEFTKSDSKKIEAFLSQVLRAIATLVHENLDHRFDEKKNVVTVLNATISVALPDCPPTSACFDTFESLFEYARIFFRNFPFIYNSVIDSSHESMRRIRVVDVLPDPDQQAKISEAIRVANRVSTPTAYLLAIFVCSLIVFLMLGALGLIYCKCSKKEKEISIEAPDHPELLLSVARGDVQGAALALCVSGAAAAEVENAGGNSALHIATAKDNCAMVRMLLESKLFDALGLNSSGQNPMIYAIREGRVSLDTLSAWVDGVRTTRVHATAVLSEDDAAALVDPSGRSALHYAALTGQSMLIPMLVMHGAGISLKDIEGNTPLHLASVAGQLNAVRTLLEEGASCTVINRDGLTPAEYALTDGRNEVAKMLKTHESGTTKRARRPSNLRLASLQSTDGSRSPVVPPVILTPPAIILGNNAVNKRDSVLTNSSAEPDEVFSFPPMPAPVRSSSGQTTLSSFRGSI